MPVDERTGTVPDWPPPGHDLGLLDVLNLFAHLLDQDFQF
jgi:hypothetical protein